jgi:hypothetical protein
MAQQGSLELLHDPVAEKLLHSTIPAVSTLRGKPMARSPITPTWVGILDFKTRFPSALTA